MRCGQTDQMRRQIRINQRCDEKDQQAHAADDIVLLLKGEAVIFMFFESDCLNTYVDMAYAQTLRIKKHGTVRSVRSPKTDRTRPTPLPPKSRTTAETE